VKQHNFTRATIAVAALAAVGLAGCGGSGGDKTATATATATATQATATETQAAPATTPQASTTPAGQREAVVPGKKATLKSGDVGLDIKVTKVADPVVAYVDRAQKDKKLVGVFVEGKANTVIEATRTSAITSLETTDGKVTGLRIIADGDCGGGFSVNDMLLSQKPVKGCIGFEIPKAATPKSITVVLVTPKGTQQASWKLPKAQ